MDSQFDWRFIYIIFVLQHCGLLYAWPSDGGYNGNLYNCIIFGNGVFNKLSFWLVYVKEHIRRNVLFNDIKHLKN